MNIPVLSVGGCLLVTVADAEKRWQHPDTGVLIDRHQLQQMLSEAAQLAQQRLGGDARVMARVLDITPRLGKEAGSVKAAEAKATGEEKKRSLIERSLLGGCSLVEQVLARDHRDQQHEWRDGSQYQGH